MGPGYPLFFEFMKSVGWLMFILTIINFLPFSYMMYDSYKELKDNLEEDDSIIALFSFGAFVEHVGEAGFDYIQYGKRRKYILASALIIMLSIFVSLIYLIFMRRSLIKANKELDSKALTPSDYCVMGMSMYFDDYSPESISD